MKKFVDERLPQIPFELRVNPHAKKTVILLSGAGGSHEHWDDDVPAELYARVSKHFPELKADRHLFRRGRNNFQRALSKRYTTFSYTPFEWFSTNLMERPGFAERNPDCKPLWPNRYFFDMRQMTYTLECLICAHNLRPPFILVGFSEGGWRALLFRQTILGVEKCVLIDPQRFNASSPENQIACARKRATSDTEQRLDNALGRWKCRNFVRRFRLLRGLPSKVTVFLNNDAAGDSFTPRFLSDVEFVNQLITHIPNIKWHIYFHKLHALHLMYRDEILDAC